MIRTMQIEPSKDGAGLDPAPSLALQPSADFAEFRRLWQIDAETLGRLARLRPIIDATLDALDENFYEPLFQEEPIRLLMRDPAVRARAINGMAAHWRALLSGELTNETLLRAVLVGRRHMELGVSELHLLVASQHLLSRIISAILDAAVDEPAEAIETVVRMIRLSVSISMKSQADAAGRAASTEEVRRQTDRLRDDLRALENFAYVDALTGLFNRRHFDQSLAAAIAHALRHGEPLCLVMADIDRFKQVNDVHGHLAGDMVLKALGGAMTKLVRRDDILVRFGGEEFAMIMPATMIEEATLCAERMRQAVDSLSVPINEQAPIHVTLSLGVASFVWDETTESLIAAADAALYRAKQLGRNRVEVRPEPQINRPSPPRSRRASRHRA